MGTADLMASPVRFGALAAALLVGCALFGCHARHRSADASDLRGTITVLVSLDGDEPFSKGKLEEQALLARQIADEYHDLHPQVNVQIELSRQGDLINNVRSRRQDGLSPDLMLVTGRTARALFRDQLSLSVPITPDYVRTMNAGLIQRLRVSEHRLAGVPVFLVPQLACFNRQRLPQSPAQLDTLMQISERGIEVGLSMEMVDLFWTVGAWGGQSALQASPSVKAPTSSEEMAILRWLRSLLEANQHLKVNFYSNQEELLQGFLSGRIDWMTCRSSTLARLRDKLRDRLGVAPLPAGPAGPATPLTISKVWVFGKDSSPVQREIAQDFVAFSINSVMQRYITLKSEQMLPVNQRVAVPTGASSVLSAMVASARQSQTGTTFRSLQTNDPELKQITLLLTDMIYGERSPEQVRQKILSLIN